VSVTITEVQQIARLARLSFSDEEQQTLLHDLNMILAYMEELNRAETSGVEPLSQVSELTNVFREDLPVPGLGPDEVFRNAPRRTGEFFAVPRVIADR
jgi:aspartyl-tRNA(Asn)/glutamyl-tRNA(Gln) amidotransferase subunit C